jgi:hypothetical protein
LLDVGQRVSKFVQQLSEVCARLAFARVGPELKRKPRSVLRVPTQRDQCEKSLQTERLESSQAFSVEENLDYSKKADR